MKSYVKKIVQPLVVATVLCLSIVNAQAQQVSVTGYLVETIRSALSETKKELAEEIAASLDQAMLLQQNKRLVPSSSIKRAATKSQDQEMTIEPLGPQL